MTSAASIVPQPNPTLVFQRAINAMLNFGWDLLGRIQAVPKLGSADHLPRRIARDPQKAEQRLIRTLDWVFALARTLAGDRLYLLRQRPAATGQSQAKPRAGIVRLRPPVTQQARDAAFLRYMRKVFATDPTNRIAKRLARRLGAKQGTDWWPDELLTITETPAAWAARAHASFIPPEGAIPLLEPPPPHPEAGGHDPEIPFHRRE